MPPPTSPPPFSRNIGILPQRLFLLPLLLVVSSFHTVLGAIKNATVDDEYGDERTGIKPRFLPESPGVWMGKGCIECRVKPDRSKTFRNTYTATTYGNGSASFEARQISFQFTGTALYVYLTLANNCCGDGVTTLTEANFTVDDWPPLFYQHQPDMTTTEFAYQQLAFSQTGLEHKEHTFTGVIDGPKYGIYLNFDYAIYTYDDSIADDNTSASPQTSGGVSTIIKASTSPTTASRSTSSSPSPSSTSVTAEENHRQNAPLPGPIAGGVVGGILILALVLFFLWRRSKRATLLRTRALNDTPLPQIFTDTERSPSTTATPFTYTDTQTRDSHGSPEYVSHQAGDWTSSGAAVPYVYRQPTEGSGALPLRGRNMGAAGVGKQVRRFATPTQEKRRATVMSVNGPPLQDALEISSTTASLPSTSNYGQSTDPSTDVSLAAGFRSTPPEGAVDDQAAHLQEAIQELTSAIQSETEAMSRAGMSDEEIGKDRLLQAMKQSLSAMEEQMKLLERNRALQAPDYGWTSAGTSWLESEEPPDYESHIGDRFQGPGAAPR
ncbi:hypothetical protein D9611_013813 [Ephemerocybe angulata]|uniref:Uncharacterized protein n=1 Tax=Ephemerocybe angulata TaxID=980116 RepID=A0A8H5C3D6_9AGAR|nr:hypothetical protein D9611_013813 [Tulosesus angulatus]